MPMRPSFTRFFLIISIFILPNFLTANTPGEDFLITLDGYKLTGNVKDIFFSDWQSRLSFENDFGDLYSIHPACIYGFAFQEKGKTIYYESKYLGGSWAFLKVEKRGQALSLYRSSERKIEFSQIEGKSIIQEKKVSEIWLQFNKKRPFRVYRLSFRKVLRQKFAHYPELAQLIGKKGFRFKNLPAIVEIYNEIYDKDSKNL